MENTKNKEQIKEKINTEIAQNEPTQKEQQEHQIIFSINVFQDGKMLIIENGQPIASIIEISFHAEAGKSPEYAIKKKL